MKVTLNWLKEYVDFNLNADEVAHRLTMVGLEVDSLEVLGGDLDSVVVAKLVNVDVHPDADRLTVCKVDNGQEVVQVVCGAKNHQAGDLVAYAQVGSVLPGNFKIKKSKIRGQVSYGMLCSTLELGLGGETDGIMILPSGLELGQPIFDALGLKDVLFELGLTPNRPDCLSVTGVAREIAAMMEKPLNLPSVKIIETGQDVLSKTSVTIEDPDLCPRYAARLIENVQIGPSPDWLVKRLQKVGMRSINNVVDVTNFVMMELGHPLHAFDFGLLREQRIVVRRAQEGDKFTTLDDQERNLLASDLVICDGVGPVALAGIMGGQNSEVQTNTRNILLESAYFNPSAIRRTSKRLGLHTESSHRFERGADIDMVPRALDRAASLIAELAGGEIAKGVADTYPSPIEKRVLTVSKERINQILGLGLSLQDIVKIFESIELSCSTHPQEQDVIQVAIPNFRPDLEREIDLIEEVARLKGYDQIPTTMPQSVLACQRLPQHLGLERKLRDLMTELGYAEVINYSFVNPESIDRLRLPVDDHRRGFVRLLNPLSEDQAVMRTTLVPGLLETAGRNLAYRSENFALFELRPIFSRLPNSELPKESLRLTGLICGRREPEGWSQQNASVDFYDVKGTIEKILSALRIQPVKWDAEQTEEFYHPGKSCTLIMSDQKLGTLGEIHPSVNREFNLNVPVFLFDLDAEALFSSSKDLVRFKPLSRYPDIQRDSAFLIDATIPAQKIFEVMNKVQLKDLESIVLFDVYRGDGVPEGKKSFAIRARYRSLERTLTDELVQNLHGKLIKALQKELGVEIR